MKKQTRTGETEQHNRETGKQEDTSESTAKQKIVTGPSGSVEVNQERKKKTFKEEE
jgi:hypothetical protein